MMSFQYCPEEFRCRYESFRADVVAMCHPIGASRFRAIGRPI